MLPRLGKERASDFATKLDAGVKAAGAASVASNETSGELGGSFMVLAVLLTMAEARCRRIAADPPREDYAKRTAARAVGLRPLPAAADNWGVVDLAQTTRQLEADLGAVLVAFERQLGGLRADDTAAAQARRDEVVEFGLRAAQDLQHFARAFVGVPLPATVSQSGVRAPGDLAPTMQAYLFRCGVIPAQVRRVLARIGGASSGQTRIGIAEVPQAAEALANFFWEWDGGPEGSFGELVY